MTKVFYLGIKKIWQIPILAGGDPQLSSALMCLTSVFGMGTGVTTSISSPEMFCILTFQYTLKNIYKSSVVHPTKFAWLSPRPISSGQLNTLLHLHSQSIKHVCLHVALLDYSMRYLILWRVSHLDAFSVYPFQTWLLSYATGVATDAPSVCPSWSSRTKDSSTQISSACDR